MADWVFTTGYLEEQTNFDLDGNGVIGDGVAPSVTYADGDNYVAAVNLGSIAALNAVKAFFNQYNSDNSINWGGSSSFKYNAIEGSAAEINSLSSIDLGNITETIFVNNGISALADVSTLEEIKSKNPGANLIYYGAKGTTKSLADSRSGGFDWIGNITPFAGKKYVTLTDLGVNPDHFTTLTNGLDKDDYIFEIDGLTYGVNDQSFIGQIEGSSLAYRSDLIPDGTTSFAEEDGPNASGAYTVTALGFANKIPEGDDINFSDYNIAGDDISNQAKFKVHFYGGEQLSHVNISGATVSTDAGYKYSQTAGSGTSTVADDIWTLELKLDAGQPAKTTSVSDNTGAEILGVMFNSVSAENVGGSNDYGGSVFRTNGFYQDIDLMSSDYKFSDLSPGFAIDGTNGEEVDFDFYFTKDYLERTFAVDFDAIDGGFAGTGLTDVDENNDHLGSYIDVSKPGSLSELRLPVTITDVSSTTAGGLTDLYEVDFQNASWSQANLSMVYGPSVNSAPSSSSSGSGGGSSSSSSTTSSTTTTTTDDSSSSLPAGAPSDSVLIEPTAETQTITDETLANKPYHFELENGILSTLVNNINFSQVLKPKTLDLSRTTNGGGTIASNAPAGFSGVSGCYLNSGAANDTITGSRFDDFFRGGAGDDVIDAGDGDDLIRGGAGSDELTGGDGVDKFFYTIDQLDNKADVIKDFNFDIGEKVILDAGISYTKTDSNSVIFSALVGGVERTVTCRFGDNVEVNDQFFISG